MNVLITGITGSGGSYLAEYLRDHQKVNIHGIARWRSGKVVDTDYTIHECDLLDLSSVIRSLEKAKPDRIFHLAAHPNVRACFDTPLSVVHNNVMGTANLLEGIRLICPKTRLIMCSTSEVYGNPKEFPMTENHPLKPVNPYAASKLAQESLAYAYFQSWGLDVVITRMFAYINPRRPDLFATAFGRQFQAVKKGLQDKIYHGNLDSLRTLIDVRDAMEAYWYASEFCLSGEAYNIGGKNQLTVGDFLNILIKDTGVVAEVDPKLLRPVDVTKQIPDVSKFTAATGWRPKYSLEESIKFLLDSLC